MSIGVPLSSLILPAYRMAGITLVAGITPNDDKTAEAIGETNRMMGTWQCERPKIFTVGIYTQNPVAQGQKIFSIGPGGDFNIPFRPEEIRSGVVGLLSTNPIVRLDPMRKLDDKEWASINLQDIAAYPQAFYYDRSLNSTTGCGQVYLIPQANQAIQIEWYVWNLVLEFATKDDQVSLPTGYEAAIVTNLAKRLSALNPTISSWDKTRDDLAREALAAIEKRNAPSPRITANAPGMVKKGGNNWLTGFSS